MSRSKTEPARLIAYALGGLGALAFGVLMVYLFEPRWFSRYIHFDGRIKIMRPLADGRLFVVEHVETGGGEDGPTTVGDRWRVVDVAGGKTVVGPFFVDHVHWAALHGDRLVAMHTRDLAIRGLDNQLLATLDSFSGVGALRHDASSVVAGEDGSVTAMADDGRFYKLDVVKLTATPVPKQANPARGDGLRTASIGGLELQGSPRAQVKGRGPDYLDAAWLEDPAAGAPFSAGGAHVMMHHQRVYGAKGGRGPMLSLVDAEGAERWRWVSPLERITGVIQRGDRLIVGVDKGEDSRGALVIAIRLGDGTEAWRLAL